MTASFNQCHSFEAETERGILNLPAAGTRQQRFYFLREVPHLIFDFLALEATVLEPGVECEVLVAAAFFIAHDLRCGVPNTRG